MIVLLENLIVLLEYIFLQVSKTGACLLLLRLLYHFNSISPREDSQE